MWVGCDHALQAMRHVTCEKLFMWCTYYKAIRDFWGFKGSLFYRKLRAKVVDHINVAYLSPRQISPPFIFLFTLTSSSTYRFLSYISSYILNLLKSLLEECWIMKGNTCLSWTNADGIKGYSLQELSSTFSVTLTHVPGGGCCQIEGLTLAGQVMAASSLPSYFSPPPPPQVFLNLHFHTLVFDIKYSAFSASPSSPFPFLNFQLQL